MKNTEDDIFEKEKPRLEYSYLCISPARYFTASYALIYRDEGNNRLFRPRKILTEANYPRVSEFDLERFVYFDVYVYNKKYISKALKKEFQTFQDEKIETFEDILSQFKEKENPNNKDSYTLPEINEEMTLTRRNVSKNDKITITKIDCRVIEIYHGFASSSKSHDDDNELLGFSKNFNLSRKRYGLCLLQILKYYDIDGNEVKEFRHSLLNPPMMPIVRPVPSKAG